MASIQRHKNGWRAQVYVHGRRSSITTRTKQEAILWARERESELLSGGDETVGDLLERYLKEVTPRKKSKKWESDRLLKMQAALGSVRLCELRSSHITAWREDRLKSVSGATVRREMTVLKHALQLAVDEWDLIPENPAKTVKRPPDSKPRERRISDDEIGLILTELGYRRDMEPVLIKQRVGAAFLFAIETAMRCGEICRINATDTKARPKTLRVMETKTGFDRDVPLSHEARRILKQVGGNFDLTPAQVDANFRKARDAVGLRGVHFHDTRHEAISRLSKKLDVLPLARMTGHKDLKNLLRYYHSTPEDDALLLG